MVYLITGSSHTGKTFHAQQLLEQLHYPYLCIDHLKMGLIRSGYCKLTPESDDEELTAYLWPVVREIIKTTIENEQNLIVEGCYVPLNYRQDFDERYLPNIKGVCLIFDRQYIETQYAVIKQYANVAEKRMDDAFCTKEHLLQENVRNLALCQKYACPYILITDTYPTEISAYLYKQKSPHC